MSEPISFLIGLYIIGILVMAVIGYSYLRFPRHDQDRKFGARALLFCWLWPAALAGAAVRGIFALIDIADFRD